MSAVIPAERSTTLHNAQLGIISADRARSQSSLAQVVVDRQSAVFAITHKAFPARQHVMHGLAERALRQHATGQRHQPRAELGQQGQRSILP